MQRRRTAMHVDLSQHPDDELAREKGKGQSARQSRSVVSAEHKESQRLLNGDGEEGFQEPCCALHRIACRVYPDQRHRHPPGRRKAEREADMMGGTERPGGGRQWASSSTKPSIMVSLPRTANLERTNNRLTVTDQIEVVSPRAACRL